MLSCNLVALLLDEAEGLGERLVEAFVWTDMLHTEHLGNGRQTLELDDGAIFAHLFHLFAILYVDIRWCVLLVMLYSKTVTWRWTLTAKALHLGSDLLIAHGADGGIVGDDFTMTCHDDFGQ